MIAFCDSSTFFGDSVSLSRQLPVGVCPVTTGRWRYSSSKKFLKDFPARIGVAGGGTQPSGVGGTTTSTFGLGDHRSEVSGEGLLLFFFLFLPLLLPLPSLLSSLQQRAPLCSFFNQVFTDYILPSYIFQFVPYLGASNHTSQPLSSPFFLISSSFLGTNRGLFPH